MWFERFVIIVTSLYRDYLPSSWSVYYTPTIWEIGFYLGTFGLFFTCYFLFSKFMPVIAIAETAVYSPGPFPLRPIARRNLPFGS